MTRQTVLLGFLAAVLVVALWWLFLYSPGRAELAEVEDEIAAAETEQVSLQQRVNALEQVRARAPETEAALAQLQSIVPHDPALAGALHQVAAAAVDSGITIVSVNAAQPAVLDEPTGLYGAPITMTAAGSYFQLVDFLRRLEDPAITARGFIFDTLTASPEEYPTLTIAISGQMFAVLEAPPVPVDETVPDAQTAPDATASPAPAGTDGTDGTEAADTEATS